MCEICKGKDKYWWPYGAVFVGKYKKRKVMIIRSFFGYKGVANINYCPNCGEKLNKEEE